MNTKAFRKIFGTFTVLALALGAGVAIRSVSAGTETGGGWGLIGGTSANVDIISWISLNDTNAGSLGGAYGVDIPSANGSVTGYAWMGEYGYLDFQPSAHCQTAANPPVGKYQALSCAAPDGTQGGVSRSGNLLSGYARIVPIAQATASGNAGGYDGWVKMSPTGADATGWGVDTTKFKGSTSACTSGTQADCNLAWSGDMGWIDFSRATYTEPSVLTVCRENVPLSGSGLNFSMQRNSSVELKAYFDSIVDCAGTDVTALASWADTTSPVVALSGTNPRTVASGSSTGSETVTVTHGGQTVTMNVSVLCVETATCASAASGVCSGDTVPTGTTVAGDCGPVSCGGTAGTRYCDFNWKEVAPGQ